MLAWLVCAFVFALAPVQDATPAKCEVGTMVPDFDFGELLGGDGRTSLHQFIGQPVLIVNWTDTDFGRGAAQQLEKVADGLVDDGLIAILHDSHNQTQDEIESAVLRLYPGNRAWLSRTRNLPFEYADNGPPPDMALIGPDGTLLMAGSYTADFAKAVKQAKAEVKGLKAGWGEHKLARKARGMAFGDGDLGKAHMLLQSALEDEPEQEELSAALEEIDARRVAWLQSVTYLLEAGEVLRAQEAAVGLERAVAAQDAWEAEATNLVARFDEPALKAELDQDEELAAIIKSWAKSRPKASHAAKLRKLAEEAGGTAVGRRAAHLADMAELADA